VAVFARLFAPSDLGLVTLAVTSASIVTTLGSLGFRESAIRASKQPKEAADTAFTLSLLVGLGLFLFILLIAPIFSVVFNSPGLTPYVRFLAYTALQLPATFPAVLWERDLRFSIAIVPGLLTEVASFGVAVAVESFHHLGVWSLLWGQLIGFVLSSLFVWAASQQRPSLRLNTALARGMLLFGLPLMVDAFNSLVTNRGDNMLVARFWGEEALAFYSFAWNLPMMIAALATTVDGMLYPVFARFNDNTIELRKWFNLTNKMWAAVGCPLGLAIALYAPQIVAIVYGPNWEAAVPILRVMALQFALRFSTGYSYGHLVLVRGRTSYMMKWGLVNTVLVFTVGSWMIRSIGPIGGAWFWLLQFIVLFPLVRFPLILQELGTLEYLRHIWQPILASLLAAGCAWIAMALARGIMGIAASGVVFGLVYVVVLVLLDRRFVSMVISVRLAARRASAPEKVASVIE
jgi:PST family polysaccharide transporter